MHVWQLNTLLAQPGAVAGLQQITFEGPAFYTNACTCGRPTDAPQERRRSQPCGRSPGGTAACKSCSPFCSRTQHPSCCSRSTCAGHRAVSGLMPAMLASVRAWQHRMAPHVPVAATSPDLGLHVLCSLCIKVHLRKSHQVEALAGQSCPAQLLIW